MKKWPTERQLLAWFLYMRIDSGSPDKPEDIEEWIKEFRSRTNSFWHGKLQQEYAEFREQFIPTGV